MCRWVAYSGSPVLMYDLLYRPTNSLIMQSQHSRLGATTMNGDGFGVGWYDALQDTPGLFHSTEPAWSDWNLRELSAHIASPLILAHIRSSTGAPIQKSNCHPYRYGEWLWVHNGYLDEFANYRRELMLSVAPHFFDQIGGSTDSELFFYLALTMGLQTDPPAAVAKAVGLIEAVGRAHGVPFPIQMTVCTTDGRSIWAFRYSSEGRSNSLFQSAEIATVRQQYPDNPLLEGLSEDAKLIVSEPLGDLRGAWREVPEFSYLRVTGSDVSAGSFAPQPPDDGIDLRAHASATARSS